MKQCWKCGREVAETSNFCGRCGAPQKMQPDRRPGGRSSRIFGIDLGGSTARIAVFKDGQAVTVPGAGGSGGCPAAVGLVNGRLTVGEEALKQAGTRPGDTVLNFKTQMGSNTVFALGGRTYTPQLLSALVLRKLRMDAAAYLNEDPEDVIITIPDGFSYKQRQAVLEAGRMAGLKVGRLISNTAAAALGTGWYRENAGMTLVLSMGSTGFDASVIDISDGVTEVFAVGGHAGLGGNDFTDCIARWIQSRFKLSEGIDPAADPVLTARIWEAAETAKKQLSELTSVQVQIPYAAMRNGQPVHFDETLTRAEFDEMTVFLRERVRGLILGVLNDAKIQAQDVQHLVFVGGGSRMPSMRDTVRQAAGREIDPVARPDECAVRGAAALGGVRTGDLKNVLLLDVTPFALGIETAGGVFTSLIPKNTTIPAKKLQTFSTAADNQTAVDVHVLEGDNLSAAYNESIGSFQISGIPPAQRGVPLIDVTFDIDANGVFSMHAKDRATGKEQEMKQLDRPAGTEARIQNGAALVEEAAAGWKGR